MRIAVKDYANTLFDEFHFEKGYYCLIDFPEHYIECDQKSKLIDILTKQKQVNQIWITGAAGCGKSIFAKSLLKHEHGLSALKEGGFKYFFYVNVGDKSYDTCIEEIFAATKVQASSSHAETNLRKITSRYKSIFILDNFPVNKEFDLRWLQTIGLLGKIVITCRKSFNTIFHSQSSEIALSGFSLQQIQQFLGLQGSDFSLELRKIFMITAGLPLALRLFQGVQQSQHLSLVTAVKNLEHQPLEFLEMIDESPNAIENMRRLFETSYQYLSDHSPDSRDYLLQMGLFRTSEIMVLVLDKIAGVGGLKSPKMLSMLCSYNFCTLAGIDEERIIFINPLLQEFIREQAQRDPRYKIWEEAYINVIQNEIVKNSSDQFSEASQKSVSLFATYHASDVMNIFSIWRNNRLSEIEFKKQYNNYYKIINQVLLPATEKFLKDFYEEPQEYNRWKFIFEIMQQNLSGKLYYANRQTEEAASIFAKVWGKFESSPMNKFWRTASTDIFSSMQLSLPLGFVSTDNWVYLYKREKITSLINLAVCKIQLNDSTNVCKILSDPETEEFFEEMGDNLLKSQRYILLGKIHEKNEDMQQASAFFEQALKVGLLSQEEVDESKMPENSFCMLRESDAWKYLAQEKHRLILYSQSGIQLTQRMRGGYLSGHISQAMNDILLSFSQSSDLAFIEKFAFDWIDTMQRYAKADDKWKEKIQTIIQQEKKRYSGHIPKNFEQLMLGLDDI